MSSELLGMVRKHICKRDFRFGDAVRVVEAEEEGEVSLDMLRSRKCSELKKLLLNRGGPTFKEHHVTTLNTRSIFRPPTFRYLSPGR